MPLNNPNFQLDVSKELIRLQQELLELQDLDELENVRFDEGSGTYAYPPPSQRAPLSQDQYDDLMEEHAARRPKTAIPQTQQAITNLRQQSLQQYNQLKQALQNDLQSTGYNGPPILDFDDNSLRIEIGCGFKEFLDRFANAMPVVRQTVATDPNDERPLQDIFREYATPRVKKEY